jgi:sugar-specific transcriptional regulator TrmB
MELKLSNFGLTRVEEILYLALVHLGPSSAGKLIKKTGLHRATVYDGLERLTEKGFAYYINENKSKQFEAADPSAFLEKIERKKEKLFEEEKKVKRLVKQLSEIKPVNNGSPEAYICHGKQGVRQIHQEILRHPSYDTISAKDGESWKVMGVEYLKSFQKEKKKKGIKHRSILNEKLKNAPVLKKAYSSIRFLPEEYTSPNTSISIFGNNTVIFIWRPQPVAIKIESKELAKDYRKHFEFLWKNAKK